MSWAAYSRACETESTTLFADTLPRSDDDHDVLRRTALVIEACGRVLRTIDKEADRG